MGGGCGGGSVREGDREGLNNEDMVCEDETSLRALLITVF